MNNSIFGYSFSSEYSNVDGNINTSHQITKMNNDSIVTEEYRNNQLVRKSMIPLNSNVSTKKSTQKKKLTGINLGRQINSEKTKKSSRNPKKSPLRNHLRNHLRRYYHRKNTTRKIRSPTRNRSVKSKGLREKT